MIAGSVADRAHLSSLHPSFSGFLMFRARGEVRVLAWLGWEGETVTQSASLAHAR
jgi:hypothetical protein